MELKHIHYFQTVARLQHITKAADQLYVAQPYLSKIIAQLEDELEVKLFDRVGKNITLNASGEYFYNQTVKIINELEETKTEVKRLAREKETLKMTIGTNVGLYTAELLHQFYNIHPEISVTQFTLSISELEKLLRSGEIQCAISAPDIKCTVKNNLKSDILIKDTNFQIILPPNHRFIGRETIDYLEVAHEPFITSPKGYGIRNLLDNLGNMVGIPPNVVLETNITMGIPQIVNTGMGLAFIPGSAIKNAQIPRERCVKLGSPHYVGTTSFTYDGGKPLPPAVKLFREFTQLHFSKL